VIAFVAHELIITTCAIPLRINWTLYTLSADVGTPFREARRLWLLFSAST
jgi:hypothetical protein